MSKVKSRSHLFHSLLNHSIVGIAFLDDKGKIFECNNLFCEFLGYIKDELPSFPIQDFEMISNRFKVEEVSEIAIERFFYHKKGYKVWGLLHINRISDDIEEERYFMVQLTDTTFQHKKPLQSESSPNSLIVTEHATDLIIRHTTKGTCLYVSPSSCSLLGYTPKELIGQNSYELIHPNDVPKLRKSQLQMIYSKVMNRIEFRIRHKKGYYLWFESTTKGIYNSLTGELKEIISVSRDCTERKITEMELKMSKEKIEKTNKRIINILQSISDAFLAVDISGQLRFINHGAEKLFGHDYDHLIGTNLFDYLPEDIRSKCYQYFKKVLRANRSIEFDLCFPNKDAWLEVRMYPSLEGVSIYIMDITDKKKVEEELLNSEERYRSIIESSPDVIGIHTDGKLLFLNKAGLTLMKVEKKEDIIGKALWSFVLEEYHDIIKKRYTDLLEGKDVDKPVVLKIKTKDREIRDVEATSVSIMYKGKPAVQFVLRDVTDKNKYEDILKRSEKLSAVGQLAAGVAHEIRNPLTSIKGFIQLMESSKAYNETYFNVISSEFTRVESIIYEFLSLAKPHQESNYADQDVNTILDQVITLLSANSILKNIEICTNFSKGLGAIIGDENSLKQVFINVLKNAIEAVEKNGNIFISTNQNEEEIIIEVKDNGCGIPADRLHRLGEPFYTLKEKGTGLGLMVSYKIIENHNGRMEIDSIEGQGTTVKMMLPKTSTRV